MFENFSPNLKCSGAFISLFEAGRSAAIKTLRFIRFNCLGLATCFALLILYIWLVPGYVLGGDNGEFVALSRIDGVAHPPGYPLYVEYLRLFSNISPNPARSAGIATAFLGYIQLLILYFSITSLGCSRYIASLVICFFGASSLSVYLNTHAEVFALNGLIVSVVLLLLVSASRISPFVGLPFVAFAFGAGLSNHHTIILVLPAVLCSAWVYLSRLKNNRRIFLLLVSAFFFVLGLSPYLLLFHSSLEYGGNIMSWGIIREWDDLAHHFLRRDYGTFDLGASGQGVLYERQLFLLWESLYWCWNILLPFALVSFLHWAISFRSRAISSWSWLSVWLSILLSGPVIVLRFNNDFPAIVERFHALPILIMVLPVAHGLALSCDYWNLFYVRYFPLGKNEINARLSPAFAGIAFVLASSFLGCFNYAIAAKRIAGSLSPEVHNLAINGTKYLPERSIVLVYGDHQTWGFNALQNAFHYRDDLIVISPAMLAHYWYARRVEHVLGARIGRGRIRSMIDKIIARAHQEGRPLFVDPLWARYLPLRNSYQFGLYRRVVPSRDMVPSAGDLLGMNKKMFDSFGFRPVPWRDSSWSDVAAKSYDIAWQWLAADLRSLGQPSYARDAQLYRSRYGYCSKGRCQ